MTAADANALRDYNRRTHVRLYALVTVYAPRVWANRLAREAFEAKRSGGKS